jgi:hypothetical protein
MTPAPQLRLKRPTGWFAAGEELAAALSLLSDAAFKLYVFLCLNVSRHSARMVWETRELANLLQRDRPGVTEALEELCRREVCIRHPDVNGRIAPDRLSVEICDRFWPYEKAPMEEFGIDQNRYVQQIRQMLLLPACVRVHFSVADERYAAILYRRGVSLIHVQRAIWLGCVRKYVAFLNGSETASMRISSLNYFANVVEEVVETTVGEDYWKHMQNRLQKLERMWLDRTPLAGDQPKTK